MSNTTPDKRRNSAGRPPQALSSRVVAFATAALLTACATPHGTADRSAGPLVIQEQGSLAVGGTVTTHPGTFNHLKPTEPAGQTYHGDHLYTFYQVPVDARKYPIVMWHGAGQSAKTWETTADGREGFQNIFLRRKYATYLIDQPRRGRAGRGSVEATIKPLPDEQFLFNQFRVGQWPQYFDGVQFDRSAETLDQFFRTITPNTGAYDATVVSGGVATLLSKTGPAILFTHSQAGGPGWSTAIKSQNVKALVAFEPGSGFVFPESEMPAAMPSAAGVLAPVPVPLADFRQLTRIPIAIYYGDNIPAEPTERPGEDNWRVRLAMAKLWVAAVNKLGGDARLVHLPGIGIRGNTHFPMSDLNNDQIADLVAGFLTEKNLD
jgi:Alpha/beta hydrolase family